MTVKPKIILNCAYLRTRELRAHPQASYREDLKIGKHEIT